MGTFYVADDDGSLLQERPSRRLLIDTITFLCKRSRPEVFVDETLQATSIY